MNFLKRATILTALASVTQFISISHAEPLPNKSSSSLGAGWNVFKFGMTETEVRQASPLVTKQKRFESSQYYSELGFNNFKIGSHTFDVTLDFDLNKKQLALVELSLQEGQKIPIACADIESGLKKKYGAPTFSDDSTKDSKFGGMYRMHWVSKRLKIEMSCATGLVNMMFIHYSPIDPSESSKL
jgi:hypothetical protein